MDPGPLSRRVAFSFVALLVLGVVSLREYLRFPRGDSFVNLVLPAETSEAALIAVFVVVPILASIILGILVSREVEKE
jgi:hypothetical protein